MMKKVMVMVVMLTLLAGSAFAVVIKGSAHDLSSGTGGAFQSSNYDEICVFCHTPHASDTSTKAPLWNRSHFGEIPATGDLYNSITLTNKSNPTIVRPRMLKSDAILCLSCHDGTSMGSALFNPLNVLSSAQPGFTGSDQISGLANISGDTAKLKNDHPIGMIYEDAVTADTARLNTGVTTLTFYNDGTDSGVMWCSTCHNVHDNLDSAFLEITNSASAMCLTCHKK